MAEYISREAAIAYIREQSEECQKAFEELGGESGIYADAYNDLAEDFYSIPAADVVPVVHGCFEPCFDENGNWRQGFAKCSNCGKEYYAQVINHFGYCPNCGAKMDGGDSDACVGSNDFCSYGDRRDKT